MAYTPHGHHIPNTDKLEDPVWAADCGGIESCSECQEYAANYISVTTLGERTYQSVLAGLRSYTSQKGVFFVYGIDTQVYPVAIFENEVELVKWLIDTDNTYSHVMFWPMNTEFDTAYKALDKTR